MKAIAKLASMILLALGVPAAADAPGNASSTVIGGANEHLIAGAQALRNHQYREGIELTQTGLKQNNSPRDVAAAFSNLCAGYAALKEFALALQACDQSVEIDRGNWRTWNNRAAANLGQNRHDAALMDVQTGLALAPNSSTLRRTLSIVEAHRRARGDRDGKAIRA